MRPLQDQCFPTPLEDTDAMLKEDIGLGCVAFYTWLCIIADAAPD